MAAPEYVPRKPLEDPRAYKSPPRRKKPWMADRPGELVGRQPSGPRLGSQGPDQGYVLRLARQFDDRLHVGDREHRADVVAGCAAVALKRASLFGRAPTVHDLRAAFTIWGYFDEAPDPGLVDLRLEMFEQAANPHHYSAARAIADRVPDQVLCWTPDEIEREHGADWNALVSGAVET